MHGLREVHLLPHAVPGRFLVRAEAQVSHIFVPAKRRMLVPVLSSFVVDELIEALVDRTEALGELQVVGAVVVHGDDHGPLPLAGHPILVQELAALQSLHLVVDAESLACTHALPEDEGRLVKAFEDREDLPRLVVLLHDQRIWARRAALDERAPLPGEEAPVPLQRDQKLVGEVALLVQPYPVELLAHRVGIAVAEVLGLHGLDHVRGHRDE
mmetsp:Transcript_6733/g.16844  ORF Transcript_6733/g.16844 Transcript_6733/m.16844 type:complete len:213 (-) Transcript_6733:346-984(-)